MFFIFRFLQNINDVDIALTVYNIAGASIDQGSFEVFFIMKFSLLRDHFSWPVASNRLNKFKQLYVLYVLKSCAQLLFNPLCEYATAVVEVN